MILSPLTFLIKDMDDNLADTQLLDSPPRDSKFEAKREWKLLRNVLTASFLFKTQDVRLVGDIEELVEEVRSSPVKLNLTRTTTVTSEVISDHRATEQLFFYIQRSTEEDLFQIDQLIENHPRRFTRSKNDPDSFINKANLQGIRPLYEACKNGYANTVQLLLDHGADPHLLSLLSEKEKETTLQVACRWNHVQVIKCLLMSVRWNQKDIKNAMKQTKNRVVLDILKTNIPASSMGLCFCKGS